MREIPLKESWIQTRAAMSENLLEDALHAVLEEHQPADRYLKGIFRRDRRIGGRDRRLYADLIFAVFRWYGALRNVSSHPGFLLAGAAAAEKINDPVVRIFLNDAGLDESRYEELFRAETSLERLNAFFRLAGVTRTVSERDFLPEWIFSHLDFAPDSVFFHGQQKRSPLWLRAQKCDVKELIESFRLNGLQAEAHCRVENALQLPDAKVNLPELDLYKRGRIEVQDLSSQCIGLVCAPAAGECWWDACAGGGGKTLHLASQMQGKGQVTASDIRSGKLDEIKRRAKLAGFSNIRTKPWDGLQLPVPEKSCDGVLIDAPCSSSGRWRRNPESRWQLAEERVAELAAIQRKLLDCASRAVKPGGVLIYATCSLFRDENRLNAEYFIAAHPDFVPEEFIHPLTGQTVPGHVQILPRDGNCDASFIARFRKEK